MLRASAARTGRAADLRGIVDLTVDTALRFGSNLLAFTDAAILRDDVEMADAREALLAEAGPAAVVRAAAVAGNFEMMNRLLDAIGVRVGTASMRLADDLGVTVPRHLHPAS